MDFLAEYYLKNIIEESVKKHFIPSIWRHYWSNINISHKEAGVVSAGQDMMVHSEVPTWWLKAFPRSIFLKIYLGWGGDFV